MRMPEYLEARDDFFASEVYEVLRLEVHLEGEEAERLVDAVFIRARQAWGKAQAPQIAEQVESIVIDEPMPYGVR